MVYFLMAHTSYLPRINTFKIKHSNSNNNNNRYVHKTGTDQVIIDLDPDGSYRFRFFRCGYLYRHLRLDYLWLLHWFRQL